MLNGYFVIFSMRGNSDVRFGFIEIYIVILFKIVLKLVYKFWVIINWRYEMFFYKFIG